MGREIRVVPPSWEHPNNREGDYQPMFEENYDEAVSEWQNNNRLWILGKHPDQLDGSGSEYKHYHDWDGCPPDKEDYVSYTDSECCWFQLYETVSEGTPLSLPFATKEELVKYLVEFGDFWEKKPWGKETARKFVEVGWAPSFVATVVEGSIELKSGVDAIAEDS